MTHLFRGVGSKKLRKHGYIIWSGRQLSILCMLEEEEDVGERKEGEVLRPEGPGPALRSLQKHDFSILKTTTTTTAARVERRMCVAKGSFIRLCLTNHPHPFPSPPLPQVVSDRCFSRLLALWRRLRGLAFGETLCCVGRVSLSLSVAVSRHDVSCRVERDSLNLPSPLLPFSVSLPDRAGSGGIVGQPARRLATSRPGLCRHKSPLGTPKHRWARRASFPRGIWVMGS